MYGNTYTIKNVNFSFFFSTFLSSCQKPKWLIPANIFLLKDNNRNTRKKFKVRSTLARKTPKRGQWRRSYVFNVNFEQVSHIPIVDFEQVHKAPIGYFDSSRFPWKRHLKSNSCRRPKRQWGGWTIFHTRVRDTKKEKTLYLIFLEKIF